MSFPRRFCQPFAVFALCAFATAAQADDRYTVSADGQEVRDTTTQLTWRRCAEGQRFDGKACAGKPARFSYAGAKKAAGAAASGWRIPTREELVGLVDRKVRKPKIDAKAFPKTPSLSFWASRQGSDDDLGAWLVSFANGKVTGNVGQAEFPLRLVKSGT